MLTIEPMGGLCNRMRAIDGAVALASQLSQPIKLIWNCDPDLGCSLERLFVSPPEISLIEERQSNLCVPHWEGVWKSFGRWNDIMKELVSSNSLNSKNYDHSTPLVLFQREIEILLKAGYDFHELARKRSVHFKTWERLHQLRSNIELFRPVPRLAETIRNITEHFDNCVGVHIRRTDHKHAILHSTTSLFIERLNQEVCLNPKVRFFLATDDKTEEDLLRNHYPERIISFQKRSLERRTPEAIEDAVIDLFCLSNTKKILGSLGSSFSLMASEIHGAPLELVYAERPKKTKW
jgi:hypothetical protein